MSKKLIVGVNDLQTTHPRLSQEWNYERNVGINPKDFTANSSKRVWWLCPSGHSWQDKINNRVKGFGCPYDSGMRIMKVATNKKKLVHGDCDR